MGKRGRRRSAKNLPAHIDRGKLPKGIYWDDSGRGHWYTTYRDSAGKQRRKRIAGPGAQLSDLHKLSEEERCINRNAFRFLIERFEESEKYQSLSRSTQKDYDYCKDVVLEYSTRIGVPLGDAPLDKWTRPMVQKLVDKLARERGPSTANHVLRYVRRVFTWSINRGYARGENPAKGIEAAEERKQRRCPDAATYDAVLDVARKHGAPYLWIVMELAYLLRLRGIEVITLTDANETDDGVRVQRRKGSRGNLTEWNPRLGAVWSAAKKLRDEIRERRSLPVAMKPEERWLFLAPDGSHLRRSSLDSAWQRLMKVALGKVEGTEAVITEEQRFSLHDLKRAGITRTEGDWAAKREAGGHKSDAMRDVYDQSESRVRPTEE